MTFTKILLFWRRHQNKVQQANTESHKKVPDSPEITTDKLLSHPDSNHSWTLAAANSYCRFSLQPLAADYFLLNYDCSSYGSNGSSSSIIPQKACKNYLDDHYIHYFLVFKSSRHGCSNLQCIGNDVGDDKPPSEELSTLFDSVNEYSGQGPVGGTDYRHYTKRVV
ncbi:hypothetical protein HGM15179_002981 [Zosterops borbonicus]|uniref:Uncharacterized protein n=1 Tax=Zosterops borbonicus TaxID=364589 RepID=A0A8K1GU54_9PASS|nr:hypothetical protein HGM15179_002981 [Zosterops borbonicus]